MPLTLVPALVLAGATLMSGPGMADLLLINGNVHTLDTKQPRATAIGVRGDRIIYVGDDAAALKLKGPATKLVDLAGLTVVPGLTDAHGHVAGLGFALARLDLVGTTSAEAIARMVEAKAATLEPGQWIRGRGWDQNDWADRSFPTRAVLDAVSPRNPVALERVDGHATWVNTAALRAAKVTRETADPPGGRIIRDQHGEPAGVLVDTAEDLIARAIPGQPSREELREAIAAAMRRCLEAGLTSVHDAGAGERELEIYRELLVEGDFPFRIYAMLAGEEGLDRWLPAPPLIGAGGGRLTVRAVKLYMDGALGSRGAALLEPYLDDPGNRGLVRMETQQLARVAGRAAKAGFQVNVHAIGDRGNRMALDAMEAAMRDNPGGDRRFRVEHAQVLAPEDIPRFARLGVIASMQPTHATSDMYWAADRVGPDRVAGAYAWRSLLSAKARLALGSDFPVESEKPLLGLYAAVTRQDAKGWPEGGWQPDQRLSREEALRGFTLDAAWAAFEEDTRGTITAGKLADLTVLTKDVMTVPARELLETKVRMTIVGGRVAWQAD